MNVSHKEYIRVDSKYAGANKTNVKVDGPYIVRSHTLFQYDENCLME